MTSQPDPAGPDADPGPEALSYRDAFDELDTILAELESDDVDVDVLGARVERAAALVRICRGRIESARVHVDQIVADLATAESDDDDDD